MDSAETRTEESRMGLATGEPPVAIAHRPDLESSDRFRELEIQIHAVRLEVEKVRVEVAQMAGELRVEMADLRTEVADLRSEFRGELRAEMADLKRGLHRWLAFGFSFITLLIALLAIFG